MLAGVGTSAPIASMHEARSELEATASRLDPGRLGTQYVLHLHVHSSPQLVDGNWYRCRTSIALACLGSHHRAAWRLA